LSHVEAVKLLQSGFALDFVITLLDRPAAVTPAEEPVAPAAQLVPAQRHDPAFWVATILDDRNGVGGATARVGDRAPARARDLPRRSAAERGSPGDWVCFFLRARGLSATRSSRR
jgi:hypothetical protein